MRSATSPTLPLGLILGTTALVAVATAPTALGQVNTQTTIQVTASVQEACSLQSDQIAIDFGVYNDIQILRSASFSYNCPAGANVAFTLSGGAGPLDDSGTRRLPNTIPGGGELWYVLHHPGNSPWIDTYAVQSPSSTTNTLEFDAFLLGGRLTSVLPGNFSDTLTLTLSVNGS